MGRRFFLLFLVLSATFLVSIVNYLFFHGLLSQGDEQERATAASLDQAMAQAANLPDIESRVMEMMRIRSSVSHELRSLEATRESLTSDVSDLRTKRDAIRSDLLRLQREVERTRSLLQQLEFDRKDSASRSSPLVL